MKAEAESPFGSPADRAQSVGEFNRRVRVLLKEGIPPCWVRGEISNLRAQASGHVYFSLKDSSAQLGAVLFRGDALRLRVPLRDGMQVFAYGEVDVYEPQGKYQLIVRAVVEDGMGRLQREFEALKQRLAQEGLFAPERKRPLPALPGTVGFITSPTGAAVRDFLRILVRRSWRGRVVVLPARVQGEGAAAEMIGMLATAASLGIFELLVIGRGGGSAEDLWEFNNEALVRAVAASPVPVISAVGHEIDFTLCDFAADARAETPSAAAELISSRFVAFADRAARAGEALGATAERACARARERWLHARTRLRLLSPSAQIERGHLRLDDASNRLAAALGSAVHRKAAGVAEIRSRLALASPERRLQMAAQKVGALGKRLASASPASVLSRGFAIVRDESGAPVIRRAGVSPGQRLGVEFSDGTARVRAQEP